MVRSKFALYFMKNIYLKNSFTYKILSMKIYHSFILLSILILFTFKIYSQTKFETPKGIHIEINGTSTLHNWEMEGTGGKCTLLMEIDASGKMTGIKNMNFTFPSKSLKSGKGSMDSNAYKAMKTDKYPNISGELINAKLSTTDNINYKITANIKLTIAGSTKQIDLAATGKVTGNALTIKGEEKLDMLEYNVNPPSFMFGSVTTGKDIVIKYDFVLTK